MLTLRRPQCNYAFLNQRDDGSTTLNVLNQVTYFTFRETVFKCVLLQK